MAGRYVNFFELKREVSFETIFNHYGIAGNFKKTSNGLSGVCPLHNGTHKGQFTISETGGFERFKCWGDCKLSGDIIEFVKRMEKLSDSRAAAIRIMDWFNITHFNGTNGVNNCEPDKVNKPEKEAPKTKTPVATPKTETPAETQKAETKIETPPSAPAISGNKPTSEPETKGDSGNGSSEKPLTFTLKNLVYNHAYLTEKRKFDPKICEFFGIGFYSRLPKPKKPHYLESMIAIPIHDKDGNLMSYCGRAIEENPDKGKYRFYEAFKKSHYLFNLHRCLENQEPLIIVEGFFDVLRLYSNGFKNVIALMGSSLSKEQENLLRNLYPKNKVLILLFDGDESGKKCGEDCLKRLSDRFFVRKIDLEEKKQPDDLTEEELKRILL